MTHSRVFRAVLSPIILATIAATLAGCPEDQNSPNAAIAATLVGYPKNQNSPLGSNLGEVRYYTPNWPFINIFKTANAWISGSGSTWNDGQTLDLDENGWVRSLRPGQIARTLMLRITPVYPAGKYHVLYDGEGTIRYDFAATKDEAASVPGHHVINVVPSTNGIALFITSTNPANYIRNIRVTMPGGVSKKDPLKYIADPESVPSSQVIEFWRCDGTRVFHPQFLKRLDQYRTLRFMDWMHTNYSPVQSWSDRAKPADARYSSTAGVPVEVMCALANQLSANPWFCIPHMADDDFVAQFATIVRDQLNPTLKVHIEYTNEVWNGGFSQSPYCRDMGLALGLDTNESRARVYYYSKRSVEIFQIFEEVFGGTDRLVRVMGSQAANLGVSENALSYNDAYLYTDALAIAPYFGGYLGSATTQDAVAAMSVDAFMNELATVALPQAIGWMSMQANLAAKYGVQLIAYEGGQHLVGGGTARDNATLNALFDAANRDPRMGTIYTDYFTAWTTITDGVFVHFTECGSFTRYGRWGTLEYLTQNTSNAPKFAAIQAFIDTAKAAAQG